MKPIISIIIPTYNRANLLRETLNGVISQTFNNWECIVIDDGSTDGTIDLLKGYSEKDIRFKYFNRPNGKIKGANVCRNYGFEVCNGDYIKWFDSDDVMMPDLLEKQLNSINDADVSVCEILKYDFEKEQVLDKSKIKSNKLIENYLTGEIKFYVCGPLWRKDFLLNQNELFDENISNLDDWDFNLRMLYQNPSINYLNEPLIKYRIHENSLSKEIDKLNVDELKSEFLAIEKHLKILKISNPKCYKILYYRAIVRYKYVLRETLLSKNRIKYYFLRKLLAKQLEIFDLIGLSKAVFATVSYILFKKGYRYL